MPKVIWFWFYIKS